MQGNLVPLIIATVNAHTMSTDIALYMCWVLSHIVYCDASARNQIDSEGGTGPRRSNTVCLCACTCAPVYTW